MINTLKVLAGLFVIMTAAARPASVTKISDTVVDTQGLTLSNSAGSGYGNGINGVAFSQEVVLTVNGWQYVTYYNAARHVCAARRKLPAGSWQVAELTDYRFSYTSSLDNDAHNVVTMGICPKDGTIHLSFDHHISPLHYRVTPVGVATNPESVVWSSAVFGPVRNYLETGKPLSSFTYPQFWQTPDGNMQMSYRIGTSGGGDFCIADYNGTTSRWENARTVISQGGGTYTDPFGSSAERNGYQNTTGYGPDGTLHLSWVWRETAGSYANHDILYACSKDGGFTWFSNISQPTLKLGTSAQTLQSILKMSFVEEGLIARCTGNPATQQLVNLNTPGIVIVPIGRYYGLMNTQAQAVDPQGRVHLVMWHCTPETYGNYSWSTWGPLAARRYYHYWRNAQGDWTRNELPGYVGHRPRLLFAQNGDAYVIYQSRVTTDPADRGIYFQGGNLTIQAATAAAQWTDWHVVHTEPGPFINEMVADVNRMQHEQVLSVMAQESPASVGQATPVRILDFQIQ